MLGVGSLMEFDFVYNREAASNLDYRGGNRPPLFANPISFASALAAVSAASRIVTSSLDFQFITTLTSVGDHHEGNSVQNNCDASFLSQV